MPNFIKNCADADCLTRTINQGVFSDFIFDFDGTLVDSNEIKRRAINDAAFRITGDISGSLNFSRWFIEKSGLGREYKIKKFYNTLVADQILTNYENILAERIFQTKPLKEAIHFCSILKEKNFKLHIASGGDRQEIIRILDENDCLHFFETVAGAPPDKINAISEISTRAYSDVLFFGDSTYDLYCARKCGVSFCFVERFAVGDIAEMSASDWSVKEFGDILL